jgi:hypothetical protein
VSTALIDHYQGDDDQLTDLLVWGVGANLVMAVSAGFTPTPVETYTRRLHAAGLDLHVAPAPGGASLGLSGRF